jgi:hypothetical protein
MNSDSQRTEIDGLDRLIGLRASFFGSITGSADPEKAGYAGVTYRLQGDSAFHG